MPLAECPSRRDLELFSVGQTPGDQVDALAGHVEACPDCQRAIETLNAPSDTFVADLRSAGGPGAFDAEQGMERALSAIAAIGRDPSFATPPLPLGEGWGEGEASGRRQPAGEADDAAEDLGTIRDYRLLAKLGEGGMGAVYKALHTHLEKIVALKVLPAERMDAAAVARFRREMRAVGKLQHPNIVGAHDAGEHEGRHFLVMEHVQGSDLAEIVRRHGPLAVADACEIVRQAAVGLQHAHEHGLVHRDIKPSNLMLAVPNVVDSLREGRAPAARDTFLRRGVGKLLLLDRPDDVDASGRLKRTVSRDVVEALKTMSLVADSIGGPRVVDPEMLWAVRHLSAASVTELHKARTVGRMAEWIESLRTLAGVHDQLTYLAKYWSALTTGAGLSQHLQLCHRDPHRLCPSAVGANSRRVWLYHLIVEWVKLADGTRTEFGVAAFMADLARLRSNSGHRRNVTLILGRSPEWRSEETVRLGLQDWQSAHSGQQFQFTNDDLARVADALARRLGKTKKPDPCRDATRMTDALVQTVLEAKLLTYRNFKPFEALLDAELKKAGLRGNLDVAVRAGFAEAATAAGAKLDPRSSGTTVMRVKNTLINWQSASDEGRDHKRKELSGRAPALRYSWDSSNKAFVKRPSTDKLILIVDGTWRQVDLDALARAGWDEIFYPDEMDRLVKVIV